MEDDAVLADPGGTAFIYILLLFVRTAAESEHNDLITLLVWYVQMGQCWRLQGEEVVEFEGELKGSTLEYRSENKHDRREKKFVMVRN